MDFDELRDSATILVINGTRLFTQEERHKLDESLKKASIQLFMVEQRGIQNSIFNGIQVILSNELLGLLINGLLMPAAYDGLKQSLVFIIKKIRTGNFRIVTPNEINVPNIVLKVNTSNGEIVASISKVISEEQIEKYIDSMIEAANAVNDDETNTGGYTILEECADGSIEILSLKSYLKKHNKID
ncbi:hypothetical protein [Listeria booriae]|uniref:hypothetical protein n=1 Tax=Listeria booriae TaxID=1552123 RepID=UPI0016263625|nr:hypothetical protein [Listeria booriae]MBC2168669.1 hypothetical protein [Listeria booriae]